MPVLAPLSEQIAYNPFLTKLLPEGMGAGTVADLTGRPIRQVMASLAQLDELGLVRKDEMGLWHISTGDRRG